MVLQTPFTDSVDGLQAVPRGRHFGAFDLARNPALDGFVGIATFAALLFIQRIVHWPFVVGRLARDGSLAGSPPWSEHG